MCKKIHDLELKLGFGSEKHTLKVKNNDCYKCDEVRHFLASTEGNCSSVLKSVQLGEMVLDELSMTPSIT